MKNSKSKQLGPTGLTRHEAHVLRSTEQLERTQRAEARRAAGGTRSVQTVSGGLPTLGRR